MDDKELSKLIEVQNKQLEQDYNDDIDDITSSLDIEEFEKKLRNAKNLHDLANSDSDDDDKPSKKSMTKQQSRPTTAPQKKQVQFSEYETKDLLSQINYMEKKPTYGTQSKSKIKDLQDEITKVKKSAQPKTEEEKVMDLVGSKNESAKDKKLKELIKNNKEITVKYERERTLRSKLEKELERIKDETNVQLQQMELKLPNNAGKGEEEWRKKYIDMEKKYNEVKFQATTLKNELNKANRVIAREIGENFDIDAVLSDEKAWKGRAQQIEVLKAKVKDLKGKLNMSTNTSRMDQTTTSDFDPPSMRGSTQSFQSKSAKDRREEIETLKSQNEQYKVEHDNMHEKYKAANARKNIVEKQLKELREEYDRNKKVFIEKSENDDKYIKLLKRELEKMKNQPPVVQSRVVYRDKPSEKKNMDLSASITDENTAKKQILLLEGELDKKERIIQELINEKMKNGMGSTGGLDKENFSEKEKLIRLEATVKALKQENDKLMNNKYGLKPGDSNSAMIKQISQENATLRGKIMDLQEKLENALKR